MLSPREISTRREFSVYVLAFAERSTCREIDIAFEKFIAFAVEPGAKLQFSANVRCAYFLARLQSPPSAGWAARWAGGAAQVSRAVNRQGSSSQGGARKEATQEEEKHKANPDRGDQGS